MCLDWCVVVVVVVVVSRARAQRVDVSARDASGAIGADAYDDDDVSARAASRRVVRARAV